MVRNDLWLLILALFSIQMYIYYFHNHYLCYFKKVLTFKLNFIVIKFILCVRC